MKYDKIFNIVSLTRKCQHFHILPEILSKEKPISYLDIYRALIRYKLHSYDRLRIFNWAGSKTLVKRQLKREKFKNEKTVKLNKVCTAHSVQCTVYSVQCTMYSVKCTVYSVQCTVYTCTYIFIHASKYPR